MWRSGPGRVFESASVLNATRVPSGEISGNAPSAIFFGCMPSVSATKMFSRCSYAILRCAAFVNVETTIQPRRKNVICFIFLLKRADRWETRILDQAFQIFSVSRHSINRVVLFARRTAEKKNIIVVDPNAVPAEKIFWR
jgi:hypothetical protein